jgi:hypothetical protein
MDMAGFEGVKPELSPAWLDAACEAYFMEEDGLAASQQQPTLPASIAVAA